MCLNPPSRAYWNNPCPLPLAPGSAHGLYTLLCIHSSDKLCLNFTGKKITKSKNLYIFLTVLSLLVKLIQPLYNTQHIKNRLVLVQTNTAVISLCNKNGVCHMINRNSMLKHRKQGEENIKGTWTRFDFKFSNFISPFSMFILIN